MFKMCEFKLNEYCRLCLADLKNEDKQTMFDFISNDQQQSQLMFSDFIMEFSSVKIKINDEFSTFICERCAAKIKDLYQFKILLESNDSRIQTYLKERKQTNQKEHESKSSDSYQDNEVMQISNGSIFKEKKRKKVGKKLDQQIQNKLILNRLKQLEANKKKCLEYREMSSKSPVKKIDEIGKLISSYNQIKYPFKCTLCRHSFVTSENLNHHFEIAHRNKSETQCDFCGIILNHIDKHYELHVKKLRKLKRFDFNIQHLNDTHVALCLLCLKHFETIKEFEQHLQQYQHFICSLCKETYSTLDLFKKHLYDKHKFNVYLCLKCFYTCSNKSGLKNHLKIHEHLKNTCDIFTCYVCGAQHNTQFDLLMHINEHCDNVYKCLKCLNVFDSFNSFQAHNNYAHSDVPLCSHCGLQFATRDKLNLHLKALRLKIPHNCPICDKTFAIRSNLSTHLKSVHKLVEKKYSCDACKKKFVNQTLLTIHKRTHSDFKPYACNQCDKTFRRLDQLKAHQQTHTGEKNEECSICFKRFSRSTALRIHMRRHTGDLPWKCENCSKAFVFRCKYLRHSKTHQK